MLRSYDRQNLMIIFSLHEINLLWVFTCHLYYLIISRAIFCFGCVQFDTNIGRIETWLSWVPFNLYHMKLKCINYINYVFFKKIKSVYNILITTTDYKTQLFSSFIYPSIDLIRKYLLPRLCKISHEFFFQRTNYL